MIDRRYDGDFLTLRDLVTRNVLGKVLEAEIHFDVEDPPWLHTMTAKKYSPGDGHMFLVGKSDEISVFPSHNSEDSKLNNRFDNAFSDILSLISEIRMTEMLIP